MKLVVNKILNNSSEDFSEYNVHFPYHIDGEDDDQEWASVIDLLYGAKDQDVINLHIDGYGGCYNTMMKVIRAIRQTNATTTSIVTANTHSAHSIIAVNCDHMVINKYAKIYMHNVQLHGNEFQTIKRIEKLAERYALAMNGQVSNLLRGFCTDDEIKIILQDDEFDIFGSDCVNRTTVSGGSVDVY